MNKSEIKRLIAGYYISKGYENKEIIRRVKNYMNTGISNTTITDLRKNDIIPTSIIEIEKIIEEYKIQIQNKKLHPKAKKIRSKEEILDSISNTLDNTINYAIENKPTQNTNTKFSEKEIKLLVKSLIKTTRQRAITEEESLKIYNLIKKLEN